jgi:cytochrome c oxidase subunit I+III
VTAVDLPPRPPVRVGEAEQLVTANQGAKGSPQDDAITRTWTDPPGIRGFFTTVQNGPIVNRFLGTAFIMFLIAGVQALLMRIQLAQPESTVIAPATYNQLFTMHGSTMMFLFAVPAMEAFASFLLPVMLGTRELPFPRMTAFGYWTFLFGAIMFNTSFLFGAAPDGGWYAYVPLTGNAYSPGLAIDFWLLGLSVAEVAAIAAGIELTVSILKFRAPGMGLHRMPLYAWAILIMGFMMLFGFTPLLVATTLLELDRKHGTRFFDVAAGGDPLLWQHLFWIFGHPDVYIQLIPGLGIIAMVIPTFVRRPNIGHTMIALSMVAIGILSFGLWVHHMFTVGLAMLALAFFGGASMTIAIPSGIQIFAWIATIWSGRPRFAPPFLYALGFIAVFVLGGLSGVMIAAVPFNWQVHDTYFIVAHFHYVLVGGVLFPIFAGLHYWIPAMNGRMLNQRLAKIEFWIVFVGFNVTFFPMHVTGLLGMPRRYYTYLPGMGWDILNLISTVGTVILTVGVALFVWNVVHSVVLAQGAVPQRNPWGAGTLDWATELPPPNDGYRQIPVVSSRYPLWEQPSLASGDGRNLAIVQGMARKPETWRGTVVTSVLDAQPHGIVRLATPSWLPLIAAVCLTLVFVGELGDWYPLLGLAFIGYILACIVWLWPSKEEREIPELDADGTLHGLPVYLNGPASPSWWAMALIITVFSVFLSCLVFAYYFLRLRVPVWPPDGLPAPDLLIPGIVSVVLVASAAPLWFAQRGIKAGRQGQLVAGLAGTFGLGVLVLALMLWEYARTPFTVSTNAYASAFFTLAGYHTTLLLAGLVMLTVVQIQAWLGYFNRLRYLAIQNVGMFWWFVIVAWWVVLPVAYFSPYLV